MSLPDTLSHAGDTPIPAVSRMRAFVRRETKLWSADEGARLVFVGKILLASFLALWIGFRLDLGMTRWSVVSIYIIMQPEAGMVIEKGFYQFLATQIGCLVSLAMAAAFYPEPELFFGVLACWAAFCLRGSLRTLGHGNFRAYGWALASYTVFVVGIPAAMNPDGAFALIVTRSTEMTVGIACATLVTALVFPVKSRKRIGHSARRLFEVFGLHAGEPVTPETDDLRIQEKFMEIRERQEGAMRAAIFEDPANAALNVRAGLLNDRFLTLSTRLHLFRMFRRKVRDRSAAGAALVAELDTVPGLFPGRALLDEALTGNVAPLTGVLRDAGRDAAAIVATRREAFVRDGGSAEDCDTLAELADDYAEAYAEYAAVYATLETRDAEPAKWAPPEPPDVDRSLVLIGQIRLASVIAALVAFWVFTDWKEGQIMVTFGGITGALAASSMNPRHYVGQLLLAGVLIPVTGFIFLFLLRPHADDFPTMCLFLSPFLALGGWWISRPKTLLLGLFFGFWFMTLAATENGPLSIESLSTFADQSVSAIVGIAACLASYRLFLPAGGKRILRMEAEQLRRRVILACREPLPGLREKFEHGTRLVFRRIALNHMAGEGRSEPLLRLCLAVLETGDAVIRFRETAAGDVVQVCEKVSAFFENPDDTRSAAARDAVDAAIASRAGATGERREETHRLHLLRGALMDAGNAFAPPGL